MADLLSYLMSLQAWWIWGLVALTAALVVYAIHDYSFFLTDLFYKFPLIGKLRRHSSDYAKHSRDGWSNVEMRLCRDYRRHVTSLSRDQFNNHVTYLKKAYDDSRTPVPSWAVIALILLIALEGLGFAYLLGSIIAFEGSENIRTILMVAVTIVLAGVLFAVNHTAGHELFRWKLLTSCFKSYQMAGDARFSSETVSLDQDQKIDDSQPPHVQCANRVVTRVDDQGNLLWFFIMLGLTVGIAIGSTLLRDATMHVAELESAPQFLDIFADGGAPAAAASSTSDAELRIARRSAAWAGFIILALLFVVTQFVGVEVGRRWGFAGRQSKKAYRATRGYADYDSYFAPILERINVVCARLETLQQMLERGAPFPQPYTKTFLDFINDERALGAIDLHGPPGSRATEPPAASPSSGQDAQQEAIPALTDQRKKKRGFLARAAGRLRGRKGRDAQ